ncbi:DUF2312 domain-containing protein [Salipiger thiooxidans]|uniref:DUF2312 domain-containing protein n=1 Tax=Salipiger thiooxidans TaxID=282683 RepID=UPI001CD6D38C|nr:DUF2312 domain-containing protein [Salipiger thiooxidans]MCA0846093.1 DUF2312 domain-containing protein [Salipiger thiooxidans]
MADGSQAQDTFSIAAEELRIFVERIERLRAEIDEIKEQEKEVFAEIKARGYMTRPIRTILKLRKRDKDDVAEEEAVLEMYKAALGME